MIVCRVVSGYPKKAKEIEIMLIPRLRRHPGNPKFVALGERLEKLKERHEQGLMHSIEFPNSHLCSNWVAARLLHRYCYWRATETRRQEPLLVRLRIGARCKARSPATSSSPARPATSRRASRPSPASTTYCRRPSCAAQPPRTSPRRSRSLGGSDCELRLEVGGIASPGAPRPKG
jgi:hypothetical protein